MKGTVPVFERFTEHPDAAKEKKGRSEICACLFTPVQHLVFGQRHMLASPMSIIGERDRVRTRVLTLTIFLWFCLQVPGRAREPRSPIVNLEEMFVEESGEGVSLHISVHSRAGGKVRADVHIMSALTRSHLYRRDFEIPPGRNDMRIGAFDRIFPSTYLVKLNVPPARQGGSARYNSEEYRPQSSYRFVHGDDVPSPATQRENIFNEYRELLRSSVDPFLSFVVRARKHRRNVRAGGVSPERTRKWTKRLTGYRERMKTLQSEVDRKIQKHSFGSPLEKGYKLLGAFLRRAHLYGNAMEGVLSGKKRSETDNGPMHERLGKGHAPPSEQRTWAAEKFEEALAVLPDSFLRERFRKSADRTREHLLSIMETVVRLATGENREENPERVWSERVSNMVRQSRNLFQTVDRTLWLYRGREHLLPEQKNLFQRGRTIRQTLTTLRSFEQRDMAFGTGEEALRRQGPVIRMLLDRILTLQMPQVRDAIYTLRWYQDAFAGLGRSAPRMVQNHERGRISDDGIRDLTEMILTSIRDRREQADQITKNLTLLDNPAMKELRTYLSRHFDGREWGPFYHTLLEDLHEITGNLQSGLTRLHDVWSSLEPVLDEKRLKEEPAQYLEDVSNALNMKPSDGLRDELAAMEKRFLRLRGRFRRKSFLEEGEEE